MILSAYAQAAQLILSSYLYLNCAQNRPQIEKAHWLVQHWSFLHTVATIQKVEHTILLSTGENGLAVRVATNPKVAPSVHNCL